MFNLKHFLKISNSCSTAYVEKILRFFWSVTHIGGPFPFAALFSRRKCFKKIIVQRRQP